MASTQNTEADVRDHLKFSFKAGNFKSLADAAAYQYHTGTSPKNKPQCGCDCDTCTVIFERMATDLEVLI